MYDRLIELASKRLVQVRFTDDRRLALFKYHRRVFYDSLWSLDPALLCARGHVYDTETKSLVVNPFDKVFNYGEGGAGLDCPLDSAVIAERKVNGFMASATWHEGKMLVSTTGSFESPFVEIARKHLNVDSIVEMVSWMRGSTAIFEIVDPSDPHIVPEEPGVYFLGQRKNVEGSPLNGTLTNITESKNRGFTIVEAKLVSFKEGLRMAQEADHEGYMLKDASTFRHICKVKSRKYLALKLMARASKFFAPGATKEKLRQTLDEEFYPLIDFIFVNYGQENFLAIPEQERLELMRRNL